MWLFLTGKNGARIGIDFGKVASFSTVDTGTRVSFAQIVTDAKGDQVFKNVHVKEPADQIAKLLKARSLRQSTY